MLEGRRVLLAVTGGVAAYKAAILARRLVEARANVKVILSEAATEFIGAQTFAAITGSQPVVSLFGETESVSPHTELARWCELIIVAPATASTIGKLANGITSDIVPATLLASKAPTLIAPAMHTEMWEHPATRRNLETLIVDGYHFVGPESGSLAGGDIGVGRMSEPETILNEAIKMLVGDASAPRLLVTAGGTREPIDPVRFIGNRSSGKMGHAIADEAARQGLNVTLVTTSDIQVLPSVRVIEVDTAQEMADAVADVATDIAIMAAAVADFQPADASESKLSRSVGVNQMSLKSTPDILASVMARENRPYVVGFAAETGGVERAVEKALSKHVDLLVYNDVTAPDSGFGVDTNQVVIIDNAGRTDPWPTMTKREVAAALVGRVLAETTSRR